MSEPQDKRAGDAVAPPTPKIGIAAAPARMKARLRGLASAPFVGDLIRGVAWSAGATAVERVFSLLQAFYIARLLGIELFGKYGLLFTTVGLVSSLTGLQLGLTAAVYIARHRHSEPGRAAAVMRLCELVSLGLALICVFAIAMAPAAASRYLLGGPEYVDVILAGALIALLSVTGGVQEGVLQGFEEFGRLSLTRAGASALGFLLVLLMTQSGNLESVIVALAVGSATRTLALLALKEASVRRLRLATTLRGLWRARRVILDFSLPSVLASLVGGLASWYGLLLLADTSQGFKDIAVLTAGQQWRGIVLYLAAITASVAVPMMSRISGAGDIVAMTRIHRVNLLANVAVGTLIVLAVGLLSGTILVVYGGEFIQGRLAFSIFVATSVPAIYTYVVLQLLVSQGRMWEQLGYYLLQSIPLAIGYFFFVRAHGALGYAVWTAIVSVLVCIVLALRVRPASFAPASSE